VTIRTDHLAGSALASFGALVLALSGDLPMGSASFPGAGMMPKLIAALIVVLGIVLVLRAADSPPLTSIPWQDLPHALRVTLITAAAVLAYQTAGFALTMGFLLFALIFGIERRPLIAAAAFSLGVVTLTYWLFGFGLKTPLAQGPFGF
jgi:hypothetical protein